MFKLSRHTSAFHQYQSHQTNVFLSSVARWPERENKESFTQAHRSTEDSLAQSLDSPTYRAEWGKIKQVRWDNFRNTKIQTYRGIVSSLAYTVEIAFTKRESAKLFVDGIEQSLGASKPVRKKMGGGGASWCMRANTTLLYTSEMLRSECDWLDRFVDIWHLGIMRAVSVISHIATPGASKRLNRKMIAFFHNGIFLRVRYDRHRLTTVDMVRQDIVTGQVSNCFHWAKHEPMETREWGWWKSWINLSSTYLGSVSHSLQLHRIPSFLESWRQYLKVGHQSLLPEKWSDVHQSRLGCYEKRVRWWN